MASTRYFTIIMINVDKQNCFSIDVNCVVLFESIFTLRWVRELRAIQLHVKYEGTDNLQVVSKTHSLYFLTTCTKRSRSNTYVKSLSANLQMHKSDSDVCTCIEKKHTSRNQMESCNYVEVLSQRHLVQSVDDLDDHWRLPMIGWNRFFKSWSEKRRLCGVIPLKCFLTISLLRAGLKLLAMLWPDVWSDMVHIR